MTSYDKLVRDKVPEIMAASGKSPRTHIAGEDEYKQKLEKKLQEEVKEYLENGELKELADLVEVVYAILDMKKVKKDSFEKLRTEKLKARGGFEKRIILEND
jgi:predicted house-cleaning noncanonical NTP pyrophosphatase (MazG superfamily)